MDVHLVILFDGSEQVIACGHFLTTFISREKRITPKMQTSGLGPVPLSFKNVFCSLCRQSLTLTASGSLAKAIESVHKEGYGD